MFSALATPLLSILALASLPQPPADDGPSPLDADAVAPWGAGDADAAAAETNEASAEDASESSTLAPNVPSRRHGVSIFGGPMWIPRWYFSGPMAAFSTANCRQGVSTKSAELGVVRNEGCNWTIGGQYIYRRSNNLDIAGTLEYRQAKLPDAMWIKRKDWDSSCTSDDGPDSKCDLGMADYVEADFSHLLIGADFTGRATVFRNPDWWMQLGGGGGFGLVIFTGNRLYQTPLGRADNDRPGSPDGDTCEKLSDLGDFSKCTPQWWDDPDTDQDGDGDLLNDERPDDQTLEDNDWFVACTDKGCSKRDLAALGSREQTFKAPVLALPKIYASARILFRETYGLNLTGGFNGGFFFSAGVQYFFGPLPTNK
jgi:hypothetical protein